MNAPPKSLRALPVEFCAVCVWHSESCALVLDRAVAVAWGCLKTRALCNAATASRRLAVPTPPCLAKGPAMGCDFLTRSRETHIHLPRVLEQVVIHVCRVFFWVEL